MLVRVLNKILKSPKQIPSLHVKCSATEMQRKEKGESFNEGVRNRKPLQVEERKGAFMNLCDNLIKIQGEGLQLFTWDRN